MSDLVEVLSDAAHEAWLDAKRAQGVFSRTSEWGEDLMVPYADLTERAKDLDRGTVRGVLTAIERAGYVLVAADDGRHVIEFREAGWTIQHTLSCRPNLFDCPVNRVAEADLGALPGPPAPPGRYECWINDLGDRFCIGDRIDSDLDEAHCRVCGCTENAACEGGCRWATDEEILAAGLEPMEGDLCSACLPGGGGRD